ncbi:MAG: cyclic nucleotide-binding domain-containing protein [Nitrospinae bacterium]|nr:cyclic nucleotide-binding domain-containing protein [Nitrospinota bacterium]
MNEPNGSMESDGGQSAADDITQIQRLIEIGISLSSERNLDALLEKIVDAAIEITNSDGCTIYIRKGATLQFTVSKNISLGMRVGGVSGMAATVPPVPLSPSFASSYAAITRKTVNIPDVYTSEEFDFRGPKEYDAKMGYKTFSMLVTPLLDYQNEVIGVLQLLNAISRETGEVIAYPKRHEALARSLASQAAVAISNVTLIHETERLFESLLEVMATATDARSKYTHGHIRRVAGLALEVANAINEADEGPFANLSFNDDDLNELRIAGWMHDIGKIVSPQHIMDKSMKLETIIDRVDLVRTRYDMIKFQAIAENQARMAELLKSGAPPQETALLDEELSRELAEIEDEKTFVLACNNPRENMEEEKIARLKSIASKTYTVDGITYPRLTADELLNLSIRKGSLTDEERKIMQSHIDVTIKMLDKIPFSRKLKNVPLYAGSHHECLDGSGYPKGLKADQMPIQSRILSLTDFLEALTAADRPYKKALPMDLVWKILQSEVDKNHLDGDLLKIVREKDVYERFVKKEKVVSAKANLALFAGIDFDAIPHCGVSNFAQGDYILRKGEYSDICHIIVHGQAEAVFDGMEGNSLLAEGDTVGEMALLAGLPRMADIKAVTPVSTLDINRDQLFGLMDKFPPVKERLNEIYRLRGLSVQLAKDPLFESIPKSFIDELAAKAELVSFKKDDVVFHQGDPADSFYLMRYGSVKVERQIEGKQMVLANLEEGSHFGEMALLSDERRMATVSATTMVEMIKISSAGFKALLEAYPGVLQKLVSSMKKRREEMQV